MIAGTAGLGHMLITAGAIIFFPALCRVVLRPTLATNTTVPAMSAQPC